MVPSSCGSGAEFVECDVASRLGELRGMMALFHSHADAHAVPPTAQQAMWLALEELLTNIIGHAWNDGEEHFIHVRLGFRPGSLSAELRDDGRPFDPLQSPAPRLDLPLPERPIGGLGIHLVRSMMDELTYRRSDGYNMVRLVRRWNPDEAPA